ncbi:MAG: hypothetical protein ACFCUJ_08730 [Thiotrichales bacterium]
MPARTPRNRPHAGASPQPVPVSDRVPGAIVIQPAAVQLRLRPGAAASLKITVSNQSFATQVLDPPGVVRLRQPDALTRGLREGFVATGGDFVSRLIALGKQLDSEPSVIIEYRYIAAFDALQAGKTAAVEIQLRLDEHAPIGEGWTARLPLLGATLPLTLSVAEKSPVRARKSVR